MELRRLLPQDATLCWDGGDFVHWGRCSIPARQPMHWLRLGALAGLGVGFPIGLAAQILRPNSPSVVITGDGSLGFYLAEMDTAVRFGLPVIIIVGNDGGWGIERELQLGGYGGKTVACELRRTRYDLVMKGLGGEGEFIETPDQIAKVSGAGRRTFSGIHRSQRRIPSGPVPRPSARGRLHGPSCGWHAFVQT